MIGLLMKEFIAKAFKNNMMVWLNICQLFLQVYVMADVCTLNGRNQNRLAEQIQLINFLVARQAWKNMWPIWWCYVSKFATRKISQHPQYILPDETCDHAIQCQDPRAITTCPEALKTWQANWMKKNGAADTTSVGDAPSVVGRW
jgi:hypothetical protein